MSGTRGEVYVKTRTKITHRREAELSGRKRGQSAELTMVDAESRGV